MIRYFKIWVIVLGLILVALVVVLASSLYADNCSYQTSCLFGQRAGAAHTPIPTLIPYAQQAAVSFPNSAEGSEACTVSARVLLSAWVSAGAPESDGFPFTDANNVDCQGTFTDVQALFNQANLWYPGALACSACHNADLSPASSAGLDLSSYAGVKAGSGRTSAGASGADILGAGEWRSSLLNQVVFVLHQEPHGHPQGAVGNDGPNVQAGQPLSVVNATPEPTPATPEVSAPSNAGGTGAAVNLTGDPAAGKQIYVVQCQLCHGEEGKGNVLNPGSDDGTVPALNPIDDTLVSSDYATNFANIDLFLQNGSIPSGNNPSLLMPAWGAQNGLTQQQIADVIAYLISLNQK